MAHWRDRGAGAVGRSACLAFDAKSGTLVAAETAAAGAGTRKIYFAETGYVDATVRRFEAMTAGEKLAGPAIIESPFTTVVVDPGAVAERRKSGSVSIVPGIAPAAE